MIGIGLNLWRRGGGSGIDVTPQGTLLVDYTVQPLSATPVTYGASGQTVINDGALGNYSVTWVNTAHDAALTGAVTTKVADGWQFTNTASTDPAAARTFRPNVTFSTPLDFTNVESLTFEWGFPLADDTCQGISVGIRPFIYSGANAFYSSTLLVYQQLLKSEKMMTRLPCGGINTTGWNISGGSPSWSSITKLYIEIPVTGTKGGTKLVLRRVWANRRQAKAKIAFHFDDLFANQYTYALPLLSAVGARAGLAAPSHILDVSDPDYGGGGPTTMTPAQVQELYSTYGWSVYPHMRTHYPGFYPGIGFYAYTAGTPNTATFSSSGQLIDALVLEFSPGPAGGGKVLGTDTVTITGGWGPEYTGAHILLSIDDANNRFTVEMGAVAPYATGSGQGLVGMALSLYPGTSRADMFIEQLQPCLDYLDGLLGSNFRGRNILVSPNGDHNPTYISDFQTYGFIGARSTKAYFTAYNSTSGAAPYNSATTTVTGTPCAVGWFDQWDLRITSLDALPYSSISQLTTMIDDAAARGHYICFFSHNVQPGVTPAAGVTSEEVLEYVVNYCKTKVDAGTAQFVTSEEVVAAFA